MRTWMLPLGLLLATACDSSDEDKASPTDAVTDTDSDTDDDSSSDAETSDTDASDTELPDTESDCGDGDDNDGDGLVDCEDGDCADQCIEDCTTEGDEDDDGLADCSDDECWGTAACGGAAVQVTGGTLSFVTERGFASWYKAGRGAGETTTSYLSTFAFYSLREVTGEGDISGVFSMSTGSGTLSCGWSAGLNARYRRATTYSVASTSSALSFADFATTGACGSQSSWFLPSAADFSRVTKLTLQSFDGQEREWLIPSSSTSARSFQGDTFYSWRYTDSGVNWTRGLLYTYQQVESREMTLGEGEAFVWALE